VYRAEDGWRIVDYKTDAALSTEDLRQRYALQLKSYARSWGRFTPERVQADVEQAR
jgi:ATP-dependent exoDNAse (exonuclease V) beta subunit